MADSKHIIIIPARYDSSRFPGKMLAKIKGKTLLQWTYENACSSDRIDQIYIATDDERIGREAKNFHAKVIMTPKSCLNGTHRVYLAAQHLGVSEDTLILNVQGDEPLISPSCFDSLCQALDENPDIHMATLAAPFKSLEEANCPSNVKCVLDRFSNALYFSRSVVPHTKNLSALHHHIGVYAFRYSFLKKYESMQETALMREEDLEQLKVLEHGYKIKVLLEDKPAFGVDLPEDAKKLEKLL